MKIIDLFCGCGGISLGFQLAGHDVIFGLDNNRDAINTFQRNFPNSITQCKKIEDLEHEDIPDADIIVGGPPCVNFSTSKGKRANVLEGLRLVQTFLRYVYVHKPKYWIMENVPRVGLHLPEQIPLRWIGIDEDGFLDVPQKNLFDIYRYGAPQKRSRLLIGNYPVPEMTHKDHLNPDPNDGLKNVLTLGDIISSFPDPIGMEKKEIIDPNYGIKISNDHLYDHFYNTVLEDYEARSIQNVKENHPFMGRMSFPDDLDKPSRTVVSLQMGRETLVVKSGEKYRRLTVREASSIQTFPVTFKISGNTWESRYRQVGNAVPPILTFKIANMINQIETGNIVESPIITDPDPFPPAVPRKKNKVRKIDYSKSRSIHYPGKEVRGYRIVIKSDVVDDEIKWRTEFHNGEGRQNHTVFEMSESETQLFSENCLKYLREDVVSKYKKLVNEIEKVIFIDGSSCHKSLHDNYGETPETIQKTIDLLNVYFPKEEFGKMSIPIDDTTLPIRRKTLKLRLVIAMVLSKIIERNLNKK